MKLSSLKLQRVRTKEGALNEFNIFTLSDSIFKAAQSIGGKDRALSLSLAKEVEERLSAALTGSGLNGEITTLQIQEMVEQVLMERGHLKTAKAYILQQHAQPIPAAEAVQPKSHDYLADESLKFSGQAVRILERRYLRLDEQGNVVETPKEMLWRVALNIAFADRFYGAEEEEVNSTAEKFYQLMAELQFLPNSPTLMNSGTKFQQISSCVVLPIDDSMDCIFASLRDAAMIHQRGAGTGFSFSRLRPKGDAVKRQLGVAAGPVSFLQVYDAALEVIKQGGVRPGANMAVLRVDHPDIIRFIESKRDKKSLKNFNLSVAITDSFLRAVEEDREYYVVHPCSGKYVGRLRARDVFSIITQNAWKTGDPGLLFIDEINRKHPAKHLGEIETTNQCGEAPLLPYEGCVLGSLNLNKFVYEEGEKREILWEQLRQAVHTAVHFLDNVIDMNNYPKPEIEQQTKNTRKFGLGMMGFADVLFKLRVKYDSEQGLELADKLMSFIRNAAYEQSMNLALQRGVCPAWNGSDHQRQGRKMRNMTCLSIAPTGTISILADASPSCEPLYALSFHKTVLGDTELIYVNKTFESIAKEQGFYSPELIRKIARSGSIQQCLEIPPEIREIFVTAQDISPEGHIKMQATLQKYVDNSISKTINFPRTATIKDVENAYLLAWKSKCKGITIYRDGSYEDQVMNIREG
ncbi:MAG: adenosylcobalamin-dependent ribonucleoside-diphosphate reductase [Nanoarchaeota archaeon]